MKVNMHEAKTNFSKLVERALAGEEIIIARRGKPLVKLTPIQPPAELRPVGLHCTDLSDEAAAEAMRPLDEEALAAWYGSSLPEAAGRREEDTSREQR